MNSRLSMTTHFFQDKPVAKLLGAEVRAEHSLSKIMHLNWIRSF
jgi:hypothetical protein